MDGLEKIYFNHIPKTGGTFLMYHLLESIKKTDIKFSLFRMGDRGTSKKEYIVQSDLIMGHLGIEPNIYIDNMSTFTVIRNPIDRLLSNYIMVYEDRKKASLEHFNNWIFNDDIGIASKSNLQTKFLTSTRRDDLEQTFFKHAYTNNNEYIHNAHCLLQENGFGIKNNIPKYGFAKAYLDKCSLVTTTENLSNDMHKIFDLVDEKWNIKIKRPILSQQYQRSEKLKKSLNKKQINKIISLNEVDMMVWEYAKKLC